MEYFYPNYTFDIFLSINNQLRTIIKDLKTSIWIDGLDEKGAKASLRLISNDVSFGEFDIEVSNWDQGHLHVDIMAQIKEISLFDQDLDQIDSDSLMDKYKELKPIIRDGTVQRIGDKSRNESEKVIRRTLDIRFRAVNEFYEDSSEDPDEFDIDIDEIAKKTMPFARAMLEITTYINSKQTSR